MLKFSIGDTVVVNYVDERYVGFVIASIPYYNKNEKFIYIYKNPYEKIGTGEDYGEWEGWFNSCRMLLTEKVHIYSHE